MAPTAIIPQIIRTAVLKETRSRPSKAYLKPRSVERSMVFATPVEPLITRPGAFNGIRLPKINRNNKHGRQWKIIDEIIALVGLHLIPKFVNLYQGQVDIRCEENDTGVLINIIVSLPDKNELQALQNQVGMDSLQAKQILEGILKLEKMDSCKPLENRQLELKRIWLNKLVSVLEEHMENTEFNVAMLCQLLGMNRKLLYRKIKQLTGVTPVSLIRRVRMIRAATLLLQGRFTVSEVMYMVGYSNPSYFSRCFMAEYNISPSQYAIIQKKTGGASE